MIYLPQFYGDYLIFSPQGKQLLIYINNQEGQTPYYFYICKKKIFMPRIARVVVPGAPYHVTQRGNYKQNIFDGNEDKQIYMDFFKLYAK